MKPDLKLDFCSHRAAKIACQRWHYSKRIPMGKLVKVGVWEGGKFVGTIVFGDGLLGPGNTFLGVSKFKVAEIVRIRMVRNNHSIIFCRCIVKLTLIVAFPLIIVYRFDVREILPVLLKNQVKLLLGYTILAGDKI